MDPQRAYPGSNLVAYFAARGVDLSPDDAGELLRSLLSLADLGAFRANGEPARDSLPPTPAPAGVSCRDRGRAQRADTLAKGPTVYNIGPSVHGGAS